MRDDVIIIFSVGLMGVVIRLVKLMMFLGIFFYCFDLFFNLLVYNMVEL